MTVHGSGGRKGRHYHVTASLRWQFDISWLGMPFCGKQECGVCIASSLAFTVSRYISFL